MNQLLSYHKEPALKKKYIARVEAHRQADQLIKGIGWEDGKGCAVGCTLEAYDHYRYPKELGVPVPWALLEDWIFENLPNGEAQAWPTAFLQAIPVGADLWPAYHRFIKRVLLEVSLPEAEKSGEPETTLKPIVASIKAIADLHEDAAQMRIVSLPKVYWETFHANYQGAEWSAAENAAWSAAESAAWSAARSAARSAAESAAESAARSAAESAAESAARSAAWSAAENAARSAAESAAWSAARSAAITRISQIALEELRAAR